MATSSTVPAVQAALVSLYTTAVNDTTVQVALGRPQDSLVKRESVFVADVRYSAQVANIKAGRKHYDEDYTIDVVFAVSKSRGKTTDANTRVWALFEHLRDLLADDPSLGAVDGLIWAQLDGVDAQMTHIGDGPVAVLVATVRCRGRVE